MKASEYSRTKNSVLNLATGIGSQVVMSVLRFIVRTIFIQSLGPAFLGIGGLFSNVMTLLSLTELGIDMAITFKLYKPLAEGDERRVRLLLKFYRQAYLIIGATVLALGLLMLPLLPHLIKNYDSIDELGINAPLIFLLYLAQSVSSYFFFAYRTALLKAAQKSYIINVVNLAIDIVAALVQIGILIKVGDYICYLTTMIVAMLIKNIICAVVVQHLYPWAFAHEEESISREECRGILIDCGALLVFKVSNVVLAVTDNFVLSATIGLAIVGYYSNYVLLSSTLTHFLEHLFSSVSASFGNAFAKESHAKTYRIFEAMTFAVVLLWGTTAVVIALCADDLIEVWIGPEYDLAQPFALLYGIQVLFSGLKGSLNMTRNVSGIFRQAWTRPIVGVVINVAVSIVLCRRIGICGVIIGTITADVLANFLIDPAIIHKHSFGSIVPTHHYYTYVGKMLLTVAATGAVDYLLCAQIQTGYYLTDLTLHTLVCLTSVPAVLLPLYWHTDACRYVIDKWSGGLHKFSNKIRR